MTPNQWSLGYSDFSAAKNCNAITEGIGDIICNVWTKHPGIDREWLKGYMDALIEYMQQNNIKEI